jgi:SAM-dependent methyltransferase
MRTPFVHKVLTRLVADGMIKPAHSLLAVCAGPAESEVFSLLGLSEVVLTNITVHPTAAGPYAWEAQNAEALRYPDSSFDFAFVCDGLHHCSSPHKALTELYRVARIGIIVFETRDSVIQRLAIRMRLSSEYELEAVVDHSGKSGGLNDTEVPNFVYRWTEREFEKTLKAFSPLGEPTLRFFYGLEVPAHSLGPSWKRGATKAAGLLMQAITTILPRQGNLLAMIALKPVAPDGLHRWLRLEGGCVRFNPEGTRGLRKPQPSAPGSVLPREGASISLSTTLETSRSSSNATPPCDS